MSLEVETKKLESELLFKEKDLLVSYLLWFFVGVFGAHRFYLGQTKTGLIMLALTLVGWLTVALLVGIIPLLVVGVWWLIDAVRTYKLVEDINNTAKQGRLDFLKKEETNNVKVES